MCLHCWQEYGSPSDWNEDIKTAVGLIKEIYQYDGAGNPLHVVLDDWNIDDEFLEVYEPAVADTAPEAVSAARELVPVLQRLSYDERAAALAYANGFLPIPEPCS